MSALKYIERLQRMDYFIRIRNTGSPNEFAAKLGISERTLYDYLNALKELGAPIAYCYHENSYIYFKDGKLRLSFHQNDPAFIYHTRGKGIKSQTVTFFHDLISELTQLQKCCSTGIYF